MPAGELSRIVRQLAQQLLVARARLLAIGDVERDHRGGALARGELARLDARQQPARAELGVPDGVARLDALALAQRLLHALVFGQRFGQHHVAADRLQRGPRRGRRGAAGASCAMPALRARRAPLPVSSQCDSWKVATPTPAVSISAPICIRATSRSSSALRSSTAAM